MRAPVQLYPIILVLAASVIPAAAQGPRTFEVTKAIAVLHPTAGHGVGGTATFTSSGDAVKVVADVTGLEPNSTHGFHIHEFGDCSAPDASSAGDHFSPKPAEHGGPDTPKHHAGDLGNVRADAAGKAHLEMTVNDITLSRGDTMILGRSVIVHEKADDLRTQPSGNSGARVACGVIGIAKSP
jgi:Cu-Zn family superoxide dismutase